jgi:hypothetical protein
MRRLLWLGTGFGLGVAASMRARRSATQLVPAALAERMRRDVEDALDVGRREMRAREAQLRTLLAARHGGRPQTGR